MSTAWSHLPNAMHIDRVLASVKAHPEEWRAAWSAAWSAARDAAYDAAYDAAWSALGNAAGNAAGGAAGGAARGAMAALIAWDDCSQYLDMPSDKLRVWTILSEDPACLLLLPAVMAFEQIEELELA